jgi:asparagine synthase (glutamine-hydrolysing)
MSMAHGVEERFPFLDHHLFDFAAALPVSSRLRGLKGKEVLRRWASRVLPANIQQRRRKSYHLDAMRFFGPNAPEWVEEIVAPEAIRRVGVFSSSQVDALVKRYRSGRENGFLDDQALAGVLSTQLWYKQFIESLTPPDPLPVGKASVVLSETAPAFT